MKPAAPPNDPPNPGDPILPPEWAGAGDFLRTLVNILPGAISATDAYAIITKDFNGVITSWNAGATKMFGYRPEEAIGSKLSEAIPDDREQEDQEMLERARQGHVIDHYYTVRRHKDGHLIDVSLTVSPVKDDEGRVVGVSKIARDISGRKQAQEQQGLLISELKHRLKNTYAIVDAIARQTLREADPAELNMFSARLHALAHANELLHSQNWDRAAVYEIVTQALSVFTQTHAGRITLAGPCDIYLDANRALLLALALHELATNAVKHGALQGDKGSVSVTWELGDTAPILKLTWCESGGPVVCLPKSQGFGLRLMERGLAAGLGKSHVSFRPEGFYCCLEIEV